jgi:regulator of sirC expression with transglutaminase-like and TPR domain
MTQPHAHCEFDKLVAGRREIDLVQFMLEIAADAYPDLDRVGCLVEIDHLGVACRERIERAAGGMREQLAAVSRQLYDIEGFHGNREAYYEPANSYLNEVLARRRGIPISLGILYLAVAGRAGLPMFGVNTPGHFVVGCSAGDERLFVDPFNGGDVLALDDCRRRIQDAIGEQCVVSADHFRPAAPLEIAARVLRNLKVAHAMEQNWPQALAVQRRIVALLPDALAERRDLGVVYLRLGQPTKALDVLEPCLKVCGTSAAELFEPSIRAARRMLAEAN